MRIEPLVSNSDLDAILAIDDASFTKPWTREMYEAELANIGVSYCFIARDDTGTVVGFCSFWHVIDELHVNNLAVAPEHRRRGVATTLLHSVLRTGARLGARRATLEVRRLNDAAQRLYEGLGFSVAGARRAYYTSPTEDALILWRENLTDS